MENSVTIRGVEMSNDAAESVREAGVDVSEDVRRLEAREVSFAGLLEECLDGVEDEARANAWRRYIDALSAHTWTTLRGGNA